MSDTPNDDEIGEIGEVEDVAVDDGPSTEEEHPAEPGPTRAADGETEVYDFRRPARISKDRKRSLEAIYALFVKSFEGWLAGRTRAPIQVSLVGLDQLTFGELQNSLTSPCAAYSLEFAQSPGQNAVIELGSDFAYYLLDRLSGGGGHGVGLHERALTIMERQITKIVAGKAASQLSEVWGEYADLDLEVIGFESIPEMLRAASREDPYLICNLQIVAGSIDSTMLIALPFAGLDGFFAAEARGRGENQKDSQPRLIDRRAAETTVRNTGVEVHVRLPEFSVSFQQIAELAPGQLLSTPLFGDTKVQVVVGDQKRFIARAGRSGPMLAAEILEVLEEDPTKNRRIP